MIDKTEILSLLPQNEAEALTSRQVFELYKGGDDVKEVSDALGNLWRSGVISRKQNPDGKLAYYRLTDSEMAIIAQSNAYAVKPTKKASAQEDVSKTIISAQPDECNVISHLEKESAIAQRLMAKQEPTQAAEPTPEQLETEIMVEQLITQVQQLRNNPLKSQVGGDHYQKLGDYQPWQVLKAWLTPEEFRGYMKGTAITYLARERNKGGNQDVEKGKHTLEGLLALSERAK